MSPAECFSGQKFPTRWNLLGGLRFTKLIGPLSVNLLALIRPYLILSHSLLAIYLIAKTSDIDPVTYVDLNLRLLPQHYNNTFISKCLSLVRVAFGTKCVAVCQESMFRQDLWFRELAFNTSYKKTRAYSKAILTTSFTILLWISPLDYLTEYGRNLATTA